MNVLAPLSVYNKDVMENTNINTNIVNEDEDEIDLLELFFILLKRWKLIVIAALVTMVAFFGIYTNTAEQKYTASIKMYVNADSLSISQSISLSTIDASSSLVPIYGEILNTHLVLDKVGAKLATQGYDDLDYYNLSNMVSYAALSDTPVFEITVTDNDPKRAIAIANTIADVLPDQIAGIIDGSSARVVDNALSSSYVSRHTARNTIIAGFAAAVLVAVVVLIVDYFANDTIRDPKYLDEFGSYPILGRIPDAQSSAKKKGYYGYRSYKQYGHKEVSTSSVRKDIRSKGGKK